MSVIFSLFAKSRARSKGILRHQRSTDGQSEDGNLPNALEMHGPDLDDLAGFFALEDPVSPTSGHASHVEQLCAVDHVVV